LNSAVSRLCLFDFKRLYHFVLGRGKPDYQHNTIMASGTPICFDDALLRKDSVASILSFANPAHPIVMRRVRYATCYHYLQAQRFRRDLNFAAAAAYDAAHPPQPITPHTVAAVGAVAASASNTQLQRLQEQLRALMSEQNDSQQQQDQEGRGQDGPAASGHVTSTTTDAPLATKGAAPVAPAASPSSQPPTENTDNSNANTKVAGVPTAVPGGRVEALLRLAARLEAVEDAILSAATVTEVERISARAAAEGLERPDWDSARVDAALLAAWSKCRQHPTAVGKPVLATQEQQIVYMRRTPATVAAAAKKKGTRVSCCGRFV
jgi:predicted NAD-dependent protein-ADP-ribosyltransferase YbiA (DUF1768 family)